ncbi:TPA: 50S ribosomal protein L13 [Candidatus Falkowbacteria bacterium]|nr:50S ribosomal protein L13 [Candidatus Falkowbacteria bacterium]
MVRQTHTIDATDRALGRLASEVASILRGKNKVTFQPHIDGGDFVAVKNAAGVKLTGKKMIQKVYHRYSGYPGGLKTTKAGDLMKKNPEKLIHDSVLKMLPKNRLRSEMIKRLKFVK